MSNRNKSMQYNTKISEKDFNLLESQRANRNKDRIEMIKSKFNGGTLVGLQERLRLSKSSAESKVLKSQYKDKDAINNASGIKDTFKAVGVDQTQQIGYANYEFYVSPENQL